jgi:hypothetical protein
MRSWLSIAFVGVSGLALVACSGSGSDVSRGGGGTGGTGGAILDCSTLDPGPDDCGKDCSSSRDCEASFCDNGKCAAQCTAAQGCDSNSTCNVSGHCVPNVGTGGTGGTGNTGGGNGCQFVTITPTRSIPNIMFLVDQSGSMIAGFGGGEDRWEAAHTAITGIVSDPLLDDIVRFGLTTYTSRNGFQNGRTCPLLPTQIDFAFNNSAAFESQYPYTYPSADGEDTPTGDSIDLLVSQMLPDLPDDGPTIIVLATDGLPDSCECADRWPVPHDDPQYYCEGPPTPTDPQVEAVAAAAAAHDAGIDVFPLWVGNLSTNPTNSTRMHMQAVANAGVGGTGTVWVGNNPASLSAAFQSIVSDSISCDIQMEERFADPVTTCPDGDVLLQGFNNDEPLICPDQWRVKPEANDVIELVGTACDAFKSGSSTFSAVFPCGAIVVE